LYFNGDFGVNVFEIGLKQALKSKNYICAKKMLRGKIAAPDETANNPCSKCETYKQMVEKRKYIS
jgi:hypothetical protein